MTSFGDSVKPVSTSSVERNNSNKEKEATEEFVSALREFSRVREGSLFRLRRNKTHLPLTNHSSPSSYSINGGFNLRFVELVLGDILLLYQIEASGIDNVQYIWKKSDFDMAEPTFAGYEEHFVNNYYKRPLETVTFHFLVQHKEEIKKCYLVLCNETHNSIRLFFSLFEMIHEGLSEAQLAELKKNRNLDSATKQLQFPWR